MRTFAKRSIKRQGIGNTLTSARPIGSGRGFVLSFAVLTLSLFILIYAQMQAHHLLILRQGEASTFQHTIPLRFAADARADLNALLDERVRMDRNNSHVDLWLSGTLPSPIDINTMLTRYQSNLTSLGRDSNLAVLLDLNTIRSDGNITGRVSSQLEWLRTLPTNTLTIRPIGTGFARYDVNIYASLPYTSTSAWTLDSNGDVFVSLRYTDVNTAHLTTSSGWLTGSAAAKLYTWTYSGSYTLRLRIGSLNRFSGSLILEDLNTNGLTATYSIRSYVDTNTYVNTGYDIPLTVRGPDGNVVTSTQWLMS